MQFSVIASTLFAACAAATSIGKRETYSQLSGFHSTDCSGSSDVLTDTSSVGECLTLGGYSSAMVDQVGDGCSVTLYTDGSCSQGPLTAALGTCEYAADQWNSYSVLC
ncbi:hypothetical protein GGR56DRAFT_675899 [Xylariaceae sp. FL0804]|nr:hypothetical protein GGR56DRAFT_675899 [Xylariaceae sp. FL0804]